MGGGPREVAEHFMELHSSRILTDDSRNRHPSPRKDYMQTELKAEEVVSYLERLRERAETAAPPSRRTQETQTVPAALLPMASSFLLQELPSVPVPHHLHQVNRVTLFLRFNLFLFSVRDVTHRFTILHSELRNHANLGDDIGKHQEIHLSVLSLRNR